MIVATQPCLLCIGSADMWACFLPAQLHMQHLQAEAACPVWEVSIVSLTWAHAAAAIASMSEGPAGEWHHSSAGTSLHSAETRRGSALEQLQRMALSQLHAGLGSFWLCALCLRPEQRELVAWGVASML